MKSVSTAYVNEADQEAKVELLKCYAYSESVVAGT